MAETYENGKFNCEICVVTNIVSNGQTELYCIKIVKATLYKKYELVKYK